MSDLRRKDPGLRLASRVTSARGLKPTRIETTQLLELGHLVDAGVAVVRRPGRLDLELPDLDDADADVVADNVRAVGAIYFAATLEELELFAVVETIVSQFMSGALPIAHGVTADRIYQYFKDNAQRLNASERAALYARTVRSDEFRRLWLEFLASASRDPGEPARAAGRALAVCTSKLGAGASYFAAIELHALVREVLAILAAGDLHAAHGVRDTWQLVERVRAVHLGGGLDLVAGRARAQAGSQILAWLAAHAPALRPGGSPPFSQIADAVARWLAAAADASESHVP